MPKRNAQKSRLEQARQRMYHDLIFESAEHVFAEKGFDDAIMQEIAAEAGVSLKTLYATFPGKRELYDEIQAVRTTRSKAPGSWWQAGSRRFRRCRRRSA